MTRVRLSAPTTARAVPLAALLVALLAALCVAVVVPAAPATARVPTAGSILVRPWQAPAGTTIVITGLSGAHSAHLVTLQRQRGTSWVKVATGRTRRTGVFRFATTLPGSPARQRYRVLTPRSRGVRPSVTPAVTVRVQPPALPVTLLSGSDPYHHLAGLISGDERWVVDQANGVASIRELATGKVIEAPQPGSAVDVSFDGGVVLLNGASGPFAWYPATGEVDTLDPSLADGEAWSISGNGLVALVSRLDPSGAAAGLFVEEIPSGTVRRVPGQGRGGDLSFTGRYVASAGSDGQRVVDMETGAAEDLTPEGAGQVGFPTITDDGRHVAAWMSTLAGDTIERNLWAWDLDAGTSERSPLGTDTYASDLDISSDGKRIVFARDDGGSGTVVNAYLWDRGRGVARALTSGTADGTYARATISGGGGLAALTTSLALDPADTDPGLDLYLYDLDRLP